MDQGRLKPLIQGKVARETSHDVLLRGLCDQLGRRQKDTFYLMEGGP